jgi:hypothetical protein
VAKKPEPVRDDQIALDKLRLFLISKLEPEDYEKANRLLGVVVVEVAGNSYKSGIKENLKK